MEKFEQVKLNRKELFLNNFLGGIAWGLGATVGLSIFLAIITFILSKINLIPIVGNFISGIVTYIAANNPQLLTK